MQDAVRGAEDGRRRRQVVQLDGRAQAGGNGTGDSVVVVVGHLDVAVLCVAEAAVFNYAIDERAAVSTEKD